MNLRWIERNGEQILQAYINDVTKNDGSYRWLDVPKHKEPEKKIEITEKEFWEIYNTASCDINETRKRFGF